MVIVHRWLLFRSHLWLKISNVISKWWLLLIFIFYLEVVISSSLIVTPVNLNSNFFVTLILSKTNSTNEKKLCRSSLEKKTPKHPKNIITKEFLLFSQIFYTFQGLQVFPQEFDFLCLLTCSQFHQHYTRAVFIRIFVPKPKCN